MKKIIMLPICILLLVTLALAGQVVSNSAVEASFLSDYHKVSTDKNPLALTTDDYTAPSTNQVVVKKIDSSNGISIIAFDVAGKTVTKITAQPEEPVIVEQTIKCWHCIVGVLRVYETTESDCLANDDMIFQEEAEKACQPDPQTTCFICDTRAWSLSKEWLTERECTSKPNQYLNYDEANKACQHPDKPILADCYWCDGGYKFIPEQECADNGGHLAKEECENPLCYFCDNIQGKAMPNEDCKNNDGFLDQAEAVKKCGLIDCWTCAKPGILYNPAKDEKVCVAEYGGFLKIEEAEHECR